MNDLLRMEIDLNQIRTNIKNIQKDANRRLIPVIKSDAYNMNDRIIMELINEMDIDYAAVVDMDEALNLLVVNPNYKILILNSLSDFEYQYLEKYPNLAISVSSLADVIHLENLKISRNLSVHIQVDTGMNRLGFTSVCDFKDAFLRLKALDYVYLEGLYTHFSSVKNHEKQLKAFEEFSVDYDFPMVHLAATILYKDLKVGNYVRVGLDVYGTKEDNQAVKIACQPLVINAIKKGESIGYNELYVASEDSLIAVLPIGYSNGFRRDIRGYKVLANNKLYEVVGIVCMNHTFVKVDKDITLDTEFIITSKDLPIEPIAERLNTASHEILCNFKIKNRIYIG